MTWENNSTKYWKMYYGKTEHVQAKLQNKKLNISTKSTLHDSFSYNINDVYPLDFLFYFSWVLLFHFMSFTRKLWLEHQLLHWQ